MADGVGLEFWATRDVIGPREVCVRRIASSAVRQVEREDGGDLGRRRVGEFMRGLLPRNRDAHPKVS